MRRFSFEPSLLRNRPFLRHDVNRLRTAVRVLCCMAGVSGALICAYQGFAQRIDKARATLGNRETAALARSEVAKAAGRRLDPDMMRRILAAEFNLDLEQ